MLFAFFQVSSPPLLRPFLGRGRPSSWSFASLLFPRTQFSLDPILWDFISAWKVRVVLTVALHLFAVLGIILEWYGPKGCEGIV
jgi:hypothetical protein